MWQERIIHPYIHVDIWIVMKKPYLLKKCLNVAVELYVGKSHVQFLDEFNFNCLMLKLGGVFTYE